MHNGKKIKLLRTYKNLTQEGLAEKINKTRGLVSSIERSGKTNHYTLLDILKVLDISEEEFDLFNPSTNPTKQKHNNSYLENEEICLLKEKLEQYQKENNLLKNMIEYQKTIIEMIEDKKNK